MNTAAAFFYGTSFESIGKETNPHPDKTPQEKQAASGDQCDYDDWFGNFGNKKNKAGKFSPGSAHHCSLGSFFFSLGKPGSF